MNHNSLSATPSPNTQTGSHEMDVIPDYGTGDTEFSPVIENNYELNSHIPQYYYSIYCYIIQGFYLLYIVTLIFNSSF